MAAPATAEKIHEVNTRYHDLAAEHYDAKWGIDYGDLGQQQVTVKLRKALGARAREAIRPCARDRGRDRLLRPQPRCAPG